MATATFIGGVWKVISDAPTVIITPPSGTPLAPSLTLAPSPTLSPKG